MKKNQKIKFSIFAFIMAILCLFSGCLNKESISTNAKDESSEKLKREKVVITEPLKDNLKSKSNLFVIEGQTLETLTINESNINTSDAGSFIYYGYLKKGENIFEIRSKSFSKTIKVTYSPELISDYTSSIKGKSLPKGSLFSYSITAKSGCKISAKLGNETFKFKEKENGNYSTIIKVPTDKNITSDKLIITAEKKGKTEEIYINLNFSDSKDYEIITKAVMESYGKDYIDIGEEYVAQIISDSAETFSGGSIDDLSRPTNNYLPYGTVDYCSPLDLYDSESENDYNILRCNYRLYSSDIKIIKSTLPKTNKISFGQSKIENNKLKLVFNVDWKAPFKFDIKPQSYKNESAQNYNITTATYNYIDITFCYASDFKGNINLPKNDIFKSYEIIKNDKDYTLRLYLKNKDGFYGWDSEYNEDGQLVFSFLLPYQLNPSKNQYGYNLKGAKIVIDAGHGGNDGGTYSVGNENEAYYNLIYAEKLKQKLMLMGASVAITREDDTAVSLEKRCSVIKNADADLVISIHFNGSTSKSANGYFMGYFNPYTKKVCDKINNSLIEKNLMATYDSGAKWHYFRLSRVSSCPVVLTENGFLTNPKDYKKIKDTNFMNSYIDALSQGIMDYFISIKQ